MQQHIAPGRNVLRFRILNLVVADAVLAGDEDHAAGCQLRHVHRVVLTHPIDAQAAEFYARFGFEGSELRPQQLLLLLKDAKRWVG